MLEPAIASTTLPISLVESTFELNLHTSQRSFFDGRAARCRKALGTEAAFVSILTASGDFYVGASGFPEPIATNRMLHGPTFCRQLAERGRMLIVDDARHYPLLRDIPTVTSLGVVAYVGVPLFRDGIIVGAFCAIDGKPRAWRDRELSVIERLAQSVQRELDRQTRSTPARKQTAEVREARHDRQSVIFSALEPVSRPLTSTRTEQRFDTHAPVVYALLLRMLDDTKAAQEILSVAFRACSEEESEERFRQQFVMTARKQALRFLKSHAVLDSKAALPPAIWKSSVLLLLSDLERSAMEMTAFNGLSVGETAAALQEDESEVRSAIISAMKKLREKVTR